MLLPCLNGGLCAEDVANSTDSTGRDPQNNGTGAGAAALLVLPGVCVCSPGFGGDLCSTPTAGYAAAAASATGDTEESGSAAWLALLFALPLVAAAAYVRSRKVSGKAELGGVDLESGNAFGSPDDRSGEDWAAAPMHVGLQPVLDSGFTHPGAAAGRGGGGKGGVADWLNAGADGLLPADDVGASEGRSSLGASPAELPAMMESSIECSSAIPSGIEPVAMLPGDPDMRRALEGGVPAPAFISAVPVPASVASMTLNDHSSGGTLVDAEDCGEFTSVKLTPPLYAVQQQNRGMALLAEDDALMSELDSSAENAFVGQQDVGAAEEGVAVVPETLAGPAVFDARRQHQSSPPNRGALAAGPSPSLAHASASGHQSSRPPSNLTASTKPSSGNVLSADESVQVARRNAHHARQSFDAAAEAAAKGDLERMTMIVEADAANMYFARSAPNEGRRDDDAAGNVSTDGAGSGSRAGSTGSARRAFNNASNQPRASAISSARSSSSSSSSCDGVPSPVLFAARRASNTPRLGLPNAFFGAREASVAALAGVGAGEPRRAAARAPSAVGSAALFSALKGSQPSLP